MLGLYEFLDGLQIISRGQRICSNTSNLCSPCPASICGSAAVHPPPASNSNSTSTHRPNATMNDKVLYRTEGRVAIITLNRPEQRWVERARGCQ